MKRKILFSCISFVSLSLIGCNNKSFEPPEYVFATFVNANEEVLLHKKIPYGTKATYDGETPIMDPSVEYVFTFSCWDKNLDEPLYQNTVFYACYTVENREYLVTFYNYDYTELWHTNVAYGSHAKYEADEPIRESGDEHIEYNFIGWDKSLLRYTIYGDTSFVAQYEKKEYVFASFKNYDDSLLERKKALKGSDVTYSGTTPTRPYDGNDKGYKFTGWDGDLKGLTSDKTFIAQFELVNKYTVTFKNYDGSILQQSKVFEGEDAVYTGSTPTRPSSTSGDYQYTYTFKGWSGSLNNIKHDLTVTAEYTVTSRAIGKGAIIEYLNNYGSGTYHLVSTGDSTYLGYSGSTFYASFTGASGSTRLSITIAFSYGSNSGTGVFTITQGSTTMFNSYSTIYTSSHRFSDINVTKVDINRFTNSDDIAAAAAATLTAASYAVNNGSNFLYSVDLPYIW